MSFRSDGAGAASSSRLSTRSGQCRGWRTRRLAVIAAILPLFALAACHQAFGVGAHGGPAVGSGQARATAIRTAVHPGFGRVVFEFAGPVPEYFAEYVAANQLRNTAGNAVPVTGTYFLRVRFTGINSAAGAPGGQTLRFTDVKQVKRVDNFEGVLIYGIGVAQRNGFRIFSLTNPSRVVFDIQQ
jgi:hypothetical protein